MQDDAPGSAMERFEEFGRKIFRVTKDDLKKVEERAEELIDEALGPPPAKGPALADEED
jgi:hypothetical protein